MHGYLKKSLYEPQITYLKRALTVSCLSFGLMYAWMSYGFANATTPVNNNTNDVNPNSTVNVLADQLYVGSLLSPSGAVTKAGDLMVESYFQTAISRGDYLPDGRVRSNKYRTNTADSFFLVKYGFTDKLSIQLTPQINYYWNGQTTASSVHFADFPVELQYRLIDQIDSIYQPSLNAYLGMNFPTGDFNDLGRDLDATGQGVYSLRFGLMSQAAYNVFGKALRIRAWGVARQPLGSTNLKNITSYGTGEGYDGNARLGMFGNTGFSLEYGLSRKWLLAFDFQYDWARGTRMRGAYYGKNTQRSVNGASHDIQIAPAVEYNFNPMIGLIVGTALTVDGHNTNDFVQPQFAVNFNF
ncbi:hypothetical protein COMNV_01613 [Commensalibacter sp. Nvir]|uniref:hypothetical protein n=1 Tax=Commensalibacter sp. Nvir TaxID=3069817 RepID=UPI002D440832|nr:hypothetical protein COMNV_01613 [Commensalibacter sp. Nvir]